MKLPAHWKLPYDLRSQFGSAKVGRQRAIVDEGHLLLVLHRAPAPHERERRGVFFWRNPEGQWEVNDHGAALAVFRGLVDEYAKAEEEIDAAILSGESAKDYFAMLERVTPLQRAMRNMAAALQNATSKCPGDTMLRDVVDEAEDLQRGFDLHQIEARNGLDFHIAHQAEMQSRLSQQSVRSSHRLNVLASVFFPLTALASIFGMNLPHGLEHESSMVFWLIFASGLALGFVLRAWVVRGKVGSSDD